MKSSQKAHPHKKKTTNIMRVKVRNMNNKNTKKVKLPQKNQKKSMLANWLSLKKTTSILRKVIIKDFLVISRISMSIEFNLLDFIRKKSAIRLLIQLNSSKVNQKSPIRPQNWLKTRERRCLEIEKMSV